APRACAPARRCSGSGATSPWGPATSRCGPRPPRRATPPPFTHAPEQLTQQQLTQKRRSAMTTLPTRTREVYLAARPSDELRPEHLAVREADLPEPGPDDVLIRNDYLLMASAYRELTRPDSRLP